MKQPSMRDMERAVTSSLHGPGRVAPHDLDLEAGCLSASLLSPDAAERVASALQPSDFYSRANGEILAAMQTVLGRGEPVDHLTVVGELRSVDRLGQVGGAPYIAQILNTSASHLLNLDHYCKRVRDLAAQRRIIAVCQTHAAMGYATTFENSEDYASSLEEALFEAGAVSAREGLAHLEAHAAYAEIRRLAEHGVPDGHSTGIRSVDKLVISLAPGALWVIAGRPGMGKTQFVLNLARHVAKPSRMTVEVEGSPVTVPTGGHAVAVFSLEMPEDELSMRLLCQETPTDGTRMKRGEVRPTSQLSPGTGRTEWDDLYDGTMRLARMPIYVDDNSQITLTQIRTQVIRLKRALQGKLPYADPDAPVVGLGMIIIDYLQLMQGEGGRNSTREQFISSVTRGLKGLAKEMGVPVVALSQLNRGVESRPNKRPLLSDLRESGAIEQDADGIMFLYRDDYYNDDSAEPGVCEIAIAKQRGGTTGMTKVMFRAETGEFTERSYDQPPDDYTEFDHGV